MKFIRKALWPTAIVAAVLMLFGALGSAINANEVKGGVQTEKGGVVYVEIDVTASPLPGAHADAVADVTAAQALVTAATGLANPVRADIVVAATALRDAANKVEAVIDDINDAIETANLVQDVNLTAITGQDDNLGVTIPLAATALDAVVTTLTTESGAVSTAVTAMTTGFDALTFPEVTIDDYTVEIDGGTGDASIVKTLKKGDGGDDGDANVVSNRARDSRTVTPVLVSDEADQEELEDYNVDADIGSYYVLVVVACDEFGSYNISFTNGDEVVDADLECATDVDSAVLSASVSTIFTTSNKLTSEITVTLEDEDGDDATPGDTVRFKTDNCEFEGSGKSSASEESETVKGDTTAGVTLDCSGAGAGTATISASVDRPGSDVYAENIVITLVGPATDLTLTVAAPMDNMFVAV